MDIIAIAGILGTFFSIATFLIPEKWKSKKITLFLFVFVVVVLAVIIAGKNSELAEKEKDLKRIKSISRAANELTERRSTNFTYEGYIQAGLAFLEQHKTLYPDSYERAKKIYEKFKYNPDRFGNEASTLSYEMDGLLKGIAVLNSSNN